jgi:hypothetical protein
VGLQYERKTPSGHSRQVLCHAYQAHVKSIASNRLQHDIPQAPSPAEGKDHTVSASKATTTAHFVAT